MSAPHTFELLNPAFAASVVGRRSKRGIDAYLGIEVTRLEAGHLEARLEVTDELVTALGSMHGGCLAALCDHVLGVIMYPVMVPGSWAATTEFKLNYLAPVTGGVCTATAEIVAMTRRFGVVRIEVENEGRIVCVAQGTCTMVPPKA